jgi:hypothetical protein
MIRFMRFKWRVAKKESVSACQRFGAAMLRYRVSKTFKLCLSVK